MLFECYRDACMPTMNPICASLRLAALQPRRACMGAHLEGVPLLFQLRALGAVPGHCVVDVGDLQLHQGLTTAQLLIQAKIT